MISVTVITVGNLKESYWREAVAEYEKRLGAFCKLSLVQLKEHKLPEDPSKKEIDAALAEEGERILAAIPSRAYRIALCVEGRQFTSEELAERIEEATAVGGSLCLIIGSSHGLAPEVKAACDLRLSVSRLTFPHQLMRVLLMEILYRSFTILKGKRYHK